MTIKDSLTRMDATKTTGNNIEWNGFKRMIDGIIDSAHSLRESLIEKTADNKKLKAKLKRLERVNQNLAEQNKKYRKIITG